MDERVRLFITSQGEGHAEETDDEEKGAEEEADAGQRETVHGRGAELTQALVDESVNFLAVHRLQGVLDARLDVAHHALQHLGVVEEGQRRLEEAVEEAGEGVGVLVQVQPVQLAVEVVVHELGGEVVAGDLVHGDVGDDRLRVQTEVGQRHGARQVEAEDGGEEEEEEDGAQEEVLHVQAAEGGGEEESPEEHQQEAAGEVDADGGDARVAELTLKVAHIGRGGVGVVGVRRYRLVGVGQPPLEGRCGRRRRRCCC